MKKDIESVSSDKMNWYKTHSMTEEQKKKLIEDKVKRILMQHEFDRKVRTLLRD